MTLMLGTTRQVLYMMSFERSRPLTNIAPQLWVEKLMTGLKVVFDMTVLQPTASNCNITAGCLCQFAANGSPSPFIRPSIRVYDLADRQTIHTAALDLVMNLNTSF